MNKEPRISQLPRDERIFYYREVKEYTFTQIGEMFGLDRRSA